MSNELFERMKASYARDGERLKADFARDGYIMLRNVLKPEEVAALNADIDDLMEAHGQPASFSGQGQPAVFTHPNVLKLADNERILPLMVNFLGYDIQVYYSHFAVKRPLKEAVGGSYGGGKSGAPSNAIGWHRDGATPQFPNVPDHSVKVGFILSDLTEPDRGNTKVIPGSHRDLNYRPPSGDTSVPVPGEVQICGAPGDAVIFTQNLWHGASYNLSQIERRMVFMAYSHCWLRPIDYRRAPEELVASVSPHLRQLLGEIGTDPHHYYMNVPEHRPLRELWMGDDVVESFAA